MDDEEAATYIKDYCRRKKWAIEKKPEQKRRIMIITASVVATLVLIIAISITFMVIHNKNVRETEFTTLLSDIAKQKNPKADIKLLQSYVDTHQASEFSQFTEQATFKISRLKNQIETNRFNDIAQKVEQLKKNGDFEGATEVLTTQLKQNPNTPFKEKIKDQITTLSSLIEKRDNDKLATIALEGEAGEKITAAQNYLATHPNGKHIKQVKQLISDMSAEFYIFVKNKLAEYNFEKDWEKCVTLCKKYIDLYDNSNSDQLKPLLENYQTWAQEEKIFLSLKQKAKNQKTDFQAAMQIYKNYLSAYPDSSIVKKILYELKELTQLSIQAAAEEKTKGILSALKQTKGRFVYKKEGMVLDTTTGLIWSMLDSDTGATSTCMAYDMAETYIKTIALGGYKDWRLPTAEELVGIYKTRPFFPATENKIYWTSESYSSYVDGWIKMVVTVTSEKTDTWEKIRKDSRECAVVRVVRKNN